MASSDAINMAHITSSSSVLVSCVANQKHECNLRPQESIRKLHNIFVAEAVFFNHVCHLSQHMQLHNANGDHVVQKVM